VVKIPKKTSKSKKVVSAKLAKKGTRKAGFEYWKGDYRQDGTRKSLLADRRRVAMRPGWRRSKSGNEYFENRKNRSDVKGKRI